MLRSSLGQFWEAVAIRRSQGNGYSQSSRATSACQLSTPLTANDWPTRRLAPRESQSRMRLPSPTYGGEHVLDALASGKIVKVRLIPAELVPSGFQSCSEVPEMLLQLLD